MKSRTEMIFLTFDQCVGLQPVLLVTVSINNRSKLYYPWILIKSSDHVYSKWRENVPDEDS